jgi:4-aminobutyrate aminotransferase
LPAWEETQAELKARREGRRRCGAKDKPMTAHDLTHIAPVWGRAVPGTLVADHGEGAYLFTTDGRRYLDFTSGIGVTNTGHAHPRVVAAIQAQAAKLLHGQANIMFHEPLIQLTEALAGCCPGSSTPTFLELGRGVIERR